MAFQSNAKLAELRRLCLVQVYVPTSFRNSVTNRWQVSGFSLFIITQFYYKYNNLTLYDALL
ncbi:hypothetical protein QTP88_014133 [Uroleucon formosanum]